MGLLIAECLSDETAIDRATLWAEERETFDAALLLATQPDDDDVPLPGCERPSMCWLEMRLGLLRAVFSEE